MKEETGFNVKVTNICKGFAILIMLIHHIFPGMEGFGLKIGQTWILPEIAAWGKVCVSIFLFLSGYGLQERYANKKLSVLEFYRKRFLSLYIPYWMVFVIFISIGFLFFPVYLNNFLAAPFSPKKNLLINFFGLQYFFNGYMGINPSWWFFSQIALIYLLYPLLCAISKIKKFGSLLLGALCFLFSFYLQDLSIKGFYVNFIWFTPFIIGMLISQHKVFDRCAGVSGGRKHLMNSACLLVFLGLSVLRIYLGTESRPGLWLDFILAPLCCYFLYRLYCRRNAATTVLYDLLAYLGVHSGNIYYIHLFITNIYTTPYIYGLNEPFFMVAATVAACLPFSIVIEKTKKAVLSWRLFAPKASADSRKLSSLAAAPGRSLLLVRGMFAIVFAAIVHYSLCPIFNWGILLKAACYAVLAVIGYLIYPFFAGNFRLEAVEKTEKTRSGSMDLLRVIAVLLVMLIHYIASIGYYGWNAEGGRFIIVSFLRWFASTCCPLFMLLTGYFAINKRVERKSWKALPSFLFSYCILCVLHICYLRYAGVTVDLSYIKQLANLSHFWYVGMHFGLLLIAPFCNTVWNNLTCKQKQLLILVLFILSSFGTVTDGLFTPYWYGLYPLLYYFIGGFIRQHNIKANRLFAVGSLLVILALQTVFTYFIADGATFDWVANYGGYSSGYNAAPTVIAASLLMILVKDINIKNKFVSYILLQISKNSLVIYLASCMFVTALVRDKLLPLLGLHSLTAIFFAESFISIVLCVLLGNVISLLFSGISKLGKPRQAPDPDKISIQ